MKDSDIGQPRQLYVIGVWAVASQFILNDCERLGGAFWALLWIGCLILAGEKNYRLAFAMAGVLVVSALWPLWSTVGLLG